MRIDFLVMSPETGALECQVSENVIKDLAYELFAPARTATVTAPGEGDPLENSGMMLRSAAYHPTKRNLVLCTTLDSALLASAPTAVQTLAATLDADTSQLAKASFVSYVDGGNIWLVARRQEGLELACYYLVRQHGARYLAPHPSWWIAADFTQNPPTESRIVTPSVGLFNWTGTGGLNSTPGLAGQADANANIFDFFQQNLCPQVAYYGGGSDGNEGFNYSRYYELRHRRSMLAWVPAPTSQRGYSESGAWPATQAAAGTSLAKPCVTDCGDEGHALPASPAGPTPWVGVTLAPSDSALTNDPAAPGTATPYSIAGSSSWHGQTLEQAEFIWQVAAAKIQTDGRDSYRCVSSEGPDGAFQCRCVNCVNLLRDGLYDTWLTPTEQTLDASDADREWHRVNNNTTYLQQKMANTADSAHYRVTNSVSIYSTHATVPRIPIRVGANVDVFARHINSSTGFWGNGPDQAFEEWAIKRATNPFGSFDIGAHGADGITVGYWDGPYTSDRHLKRLVGQCLDAGYTAFTWQTTYGFAPMVPIWYALARWFNGDDFDDAIESWFTDAFGSGSVRTIIRALYAKWWASSLNGDGIAVDIRSRFDWNYVDVSEVFAAMLAAQTALDAAPDADVQLRIDHLKAYAQHLRLYTEYVPLERAYLLAGSPASGATHDAYVAGLVALHSWNYNLYSTNILHHSRLSEKWYLALVAAPAPTEAAYWSYLGSGGAGAVAAAMPSSGALQTVCVNGAAAYPPISGLTRVIYSDALVPYTTTADTTPVTFKWMGPGVHYYVLQKPAGDITITVTTAHGATATDPTKLRIYSLDGETLHQSWESPLGTSTSYPVTLTGYGAGQYVVQITEHRTVGLSRLVVTRNIPISYTGMWNLDGADEANRVYFYVPAGVTKIGLIYDSYAASALTFYNPSGVAVTTTQLAPNLWTCPVAGGLDDAIWSWTYGHGRSSLRYPIPINFPAVWAFHPDQLLIPAELV